MISRKKFCILNSYRQLDNSCDCNYMVQWMNHISYNKMSSKIQFKLKSLFKKMYFGKTMLIGVLSMASACSFYDSAINNPTPSTMVISKAATQEIIPATTEKGTTGAMDIASSTDTDMVTKLKTTASIVETQVIGTKTDEEVDGTDTLVTLSASPEAESSTISSMFFMWSEFGFSCCFLRLPFQILLIENR